MDKSKRRERILTMSLNLDWSDSDYCCLNCEDKICNEGEYCNHCYCQQCIWYGYDDEVGRGYCTLVRDHAQPKEEDE